jgi:hypothetical protein
LVRLIADRADHLDRDRLGDRRRIRRDLRRPDLGFHQIHRDHPDPREHHRNLDVRLVGVRRPELLPELPVRLEQLLELRFVCSLQS